MPDVDYVANKINDANVQAKLMIPEEVDASQTYLGGATKTITVNAFERSREARAKCIEHHGLACGVCDYEVAELYGPLGEGIIHAHHLRNLAALGREYEVDPHHRPSTRMPDLSRHPTYLFPGNEHHAIAPSPFGSEIDQMAYEI